MLTVKINRVNFEYDVNSIVKAFFPEETVKVITPETGQEKRDSWESDLKLEIAFEEKGARITSRLKEKALPEEGCTEIWNWSYDEAAEEGDSYKNAFKRFLYSRLP